MIHPHLHYGITVWEKAFDKHLTLIVPGGEGGKFAPPLSYFDIASKLKKVLL